MLMEIPKRTPDTLRPDSRLGCLGAIAFSIVVWAAFAFFAWRATR